MSERLQNTAARMREKMLQRYGDEFHHKHDKNHIPFRHHCRTHPVENSRYEPNGDRDINDSTGLIRKQKLRRFSKGLRNRTVH